MYKEISIVIAVLTIWYFIFSLFSVNSHQLISENWSIVLIAFVAAVVANATAIGGGFIFLPLFTFYYDISPIESLKLALSTQAFGMTSGAVSWPRNLILWNHLFVACMASSIGMTLGTFFFVPDNNLVNMTFGITSLILGFALIIELWFGKKVKEATTNITKSQRLIFIVLCVMGGMVSAWISIGVGEVVALWLLFMWRYNIAQSIATGVAALAFCSILGLIFHSYLGGIPWNYLAFTVPGVILGGRVGAHLGARLARKGSTKSAGGQLKAFVATVIFFDGVIVLFNTL